MKGLLFRIAGSLIGLSCLLAALSCARDQTLDWIAVKPENVTLSGTPTIIYTAIGHYSHPSQERDISTQVTWQTDAPSIIAFSDPSHPNYLIPTGFGCGTNLGVLAFVYRHPGNNQEVHGGSTVNVQCASGGGGSGTDFDMTANPSTANVPAGGTAQITINVTVLSGSPSVNLILQLPPAGISASFNPPTVAAPGSSILTINVSPTATAGTYNLTIVGTDGSGQVAIPLTLNVS
jgi:hypothetical protein